jgi:ATP/maltotriose-dependent transcriptional regulator MalT
VDKSFKDIAREFEQDHLYDADTRRRLYVLIDDYHHVVNTFTNVSTPFARMLADYAIDKWTEYEELLWQK